jgi:hypothetical protein
MTASSMTTEIMTEISAGNLKAKLPTHLFPPFIFATNINATEGIAQISARIASFSIFSTV